MVKLASVECLVIILLCSARSYYCKNKLPDHEKQSSVNEADQNHYSVSYDQHPTKEMLKETVTSKAHVQKEHPDIVIDKWTKPVANTDNEMTDDTEEITVEIEDDKEDTYTGQIPPLLPTPDKFISPQDLMGILGKGLEAAKMVANLVSMGFGSPIRRNDEPVPPDGSNRRRQPEREKINLDEINHPLLSTISGFFNLIGVDRKKISTLAVNSLVVLVHLIINNLLGKDVEKPNKLPEGNLYAWIFNSSPPQLKELLHQIQEPGVEERIIGLVREDSSGDTVCVQLLLCRLAPVIWGMQRALTQPPPSDWASLSPVDRMFAYFPSFQELINHRPRCEIRFPNCRIKYSHLYEDFEKAINQMQHPH